MAAKIKPVRPLTNLQYEVLWGVALNLVGEYHPQANGRYPFAMLRGKNVVGQLMALRKKRLITLNFKVSRPELTTEGGWRLFDEAKRRQPPDVVDVVYWGA